MGAKKKNPDGGRLSRDPKDVLIAVLVLALAVCISLLLTAPLTTTPPPAHVTSKPATSIDDAEDALDRLLGPVGGETTAAAAELEGGYTYGADGVRIRTELPQGTFGKIYDRKFTDLVRPLYDSHMGTENMAPLLYSLIRFVKPRHILEIGAGYTSIFMAQALRDNQIEMARFKQIQVEEKCVIPVNSTYDVPQCVEAMVEERSGPGVLHTVDDLSHPGQTADKVQAAARQLGCDRNLQLHVKDAWGFASEMDPSIELDLIWLDFGVGERADEFLDKWWPRLNKKGGLLAVHSSLTNVATRQWLVSYQIDGADPLKDRLGNFDLFGLLEPHKQFQNSFSIFQKRSDMWMEPVYSMGP